MMTEKEFRDKVMPLRRIMYGLALRLDIPPDDAADAVQDTLIRLWHKRALIPSEISQLRLYCVASIRNECLTRIRLRRETVSIDDLSYLESSCFDTVEQADICRRIETLIDRLPANQREVLRMTAFERFDSRQISKATGQGEGNVRQLLSRGRRRLRELIDKIDKS